MKLFNIDKWKDKSISPRNEPEENDLLVKIDNSQQYAEGGKRSDIETYWEDEYKIYQGGGKQWDTTKGKRNLRGKNRNFNSEDNFVFPMICNTLAPFSNAPTMGISGVEERDNETGDILNGLVPFVLSRNKFQDQWDKIVEQLDKYGPAIGYVGYDQHWIGGSGPDKWVGEITTQYVKKDEFFPDTAILDMEERLQECSFINIKKRKKIEWFAEQWDKGQYVTEDTEDIPKGQEDEGQDPKQATLIIHYHKGTPAYVSKEWKKIFLEKAAEAEADGLPYKAQDYRDMTDGTLKGVHCAYKANNILLDYIPYIYDDGLYPFVYRVLYRDEKQPWGMGEIRNVVIPQILHNKADEIELGAMLSQGIGGAYYNKGSLSNSQRDELLDNLAKPNAWIEVNDSNGIHERKQTTVPASITNYKAEKKNMIDTISGNTAILQGESIGANVPFKTVKELADRADARTRRKAKVMESFMIEFVQLIINRIAQFYTEDRKYRILGQNQTEALQANAYKILQQIAGMPQGTLPEDQMQAMVNLLKDVAVKTEKPKSKIFKRKMLVKTWEREVVYDESGQEIIKKEEFIPEFDITVKVAEDRPTDRSYYVTLATQLLGKAMGPKCFWKTIDEGKFPPINEILEELDEIQQAQAQAQAQAEQTDLQNRQSDKQADRQYGVYKQKLQNDSVEKQVAMKVYQKMAEKVGVQNGQQQFNS